MTQPKVAIVVTSYWEKAKPLLDLCMESIANLDYPKERLQVILVTRPGYTPKYEGVTTVFPKKERFGCAEGINYGMSWADSDCDFVMNANDDVIFTRDSLKELLLTAGDNDIMLAPVSNCSQGKLYWLYSGCAKGQELELFMRHQYKLQDLEPHKERLMNARSIYPQGIIFRDHLFTYACLMPRRVWDRVGGYDENFFVGFDDVDHCWRARALGIPCGIALNALVWHFSGSSADHTLTNEIRQRNQDYFLEKWGRLPDQILRPKFEGKVATSDLIGE